MAMAERARELSRRFAMLLIFAQVAAKYQKQPMGQFWGEPILDSIAGAH
jgi:hypothetical protein